TPLPTLRLEQVTTGPSETVMTELSDGTIVHLAPGSHIRVMDAENRREVWLEGRAFFGVASHGDQWPFVVRSRLGNVKVLGTRFELSTENEDLRVVVVEGQVNLLTGAEQLEIRANQMTVATLSAEPVLREIQDLDEL